MNTSVPWPGLVEADKRVLRMQQKLHNWRHCRLMRTRRAGCGESRTSGSEGGPEKPTGENVRTALRSDPYTRLLGPRTWTYYYLYVLLDLFSRYAVGWMVADKENSALARRLIEETCIKYGVEPSVLTLHSDRGAPMTSQGTAQLLARLGVNRSLGRPRVSDDNPFSEAQFKTLKYHPGFPRRFPEQDAATAYCRSFFPWYNTEHRHAGIAMLTPETVHYGRAQAVLEQRQRALSAAWRRHPERRGSALLQRSQRRSPGSPR